MIPYIHKYIYHFEIVKSLPLVLFLDDEITARYNMLQSLSVSDLEDSLEHNIHCTQEMQAQIVAKMSKLQEDPT